MLGQYSEGDSIMADIMDRITDVRNAARPNSARVATARTIGSQTLACDNLVGWPTASKVHFVTYQIDTNGNPIAGTQIDCSGIVSANSITQIVVIDGNDGGNSVGDVVEMLPTAAWGQDLADALTNQHSRTGTHEGVTNTGGMTTDTLIVTSGTTLPAGDITNADLAGSITSSKIIGIDKSILTTDSNPYKFSAYRSAAWTPGNAAVVPFDAELFDTNNNFDITTNKGRYTVPVTGFYQLNACVSLTQTGGNPGIQSYIVKNGTTTVAYGISTLCVAGSWTYTMPVASLLSLVAGDYLEVYVYSSSLGGQTGIALTYFNGFLVSRT